MWDNFIGRQIQRCNRNLLVANLMLLVVIISYATIRTRYLAGLLFRATEISNRELATLHDSNSRSGLIVRVNGDRLFDTGVQSVEQTLDSSNQVQSTKISAEYKILTVGEKLLLIKADPAASGTTFTGMMVPIPASVNESVVAPTIQDEPQLQGMFIPAMLDATDYANEGWWALGIGIPILLLSGWNLIKWKKRAWDYSCHPIYKRLSCFGSVADIVQQIETARLANPASKMAGVELSGPWLFSKTAFGFTCFHLPDSVWLYEKVTKHSVNFIPTGKSYAALLYDRYGYSTVIPAKQKEVAALMTHIVQQCPWIIAGFSKELESLWASQKDAFIAAVDKRRNEIPKGAGASAG